MRGERAVEDLSVSLNILLDSIDPDHLVNHIPEGERRPYHLVDYLPEKEIHELSSDVLYVGKLSRAIARNREEVGYHYVCIRDRIPDDQETEQLLQGIVIVNENISLHELFTILQQQQLKIFNWILKMKDCLVGDGSYQELFDISEDVLENFTSAIDVAYKLIAYTKNHLSDDPINTALVEKGYHSEETMKAIQKANRFPVYDREDGVIVNLPGNPTVYATISKWFKFSGNAYTHIIMICNNRPPSPGLIEMFSIFLGQASICFQRQIRQSSNRSQSYYSLFSDMAFGKLENPNTIADRAKCVNLPFQGDFILFEIVFENNNLVPVGRFVDELSVCLPNAKIIFQNYEVIGLSSDVDPNGFREAFAHQVKELFSQYGVFCGISAPFKRLSDFHVAYNQARHAQAIGQKFDKAGDRWGFSDGTRECVFHPNHLHIYTHDKIFPYYMLHQAQVNSPEVFYNNIYIDAVGKLQEESARILYIYLIADRSPTATGNLLHTNRNNIIYRIARIEEELGMDLNDYDVRFRLMLAYKYWEMQHIEAELIE